MEHLESAVVHRALVLDDRWRDADAECRCAVPNGPDFRFNALRQNFGRDHDEPERKSGPGRRLFLGHAGDLVRKLPGVLRYPCTDYSGGDVPNATYRNHGTHAEALEVEFDPTQTSFRDLLEFFFQIHDPSTPGRQGQ